MEKLFLIDAYALIYRSYYVFIDNPRLNSKGQNTSAVFGFINTLHDVLTKERPDYIGVAFDPPGKTFRHERYPAYKAQRQAAPEDVKNSVPVIKELLGCYHIPVYEAAGFEADDVIGTLTKKASEKDILTYMLTSDKDYGQLVTPRVFMYRPERRGYDIWGPDEIEEKYGLARPSQIIDLLGLMGDASDNIPGCPGVGQKTATALIRQFDNIDNLLEHTDNLKGTLREKIEKNAEQIRFSRFLAAIRTDVPLAFDSDALRAREPDLTALSSLLDTLEFKGMERRVLSYYERKGRVGIRQNDLFVSSSAGVDATEGETSAFESMKTTPHDYHLVESEEEARRLSAFLLTHDTVSVDTETTSTDAIDAELVGLSFSVREREAWYVPVPADSLQARRMVEIFRPVYEDAGILKVGQNLKYDYEVLHRYGIVMGGEMWDTMLAHYVTRPELRHNMDYMAETLLHYRTVRIEELIGPKGKGQRSMRDLSPALVYEYAAEDADITLRLKNRLEPMLSDNGALSLFHDIEMPLMPVLADMELGGVRIDTDSLKETSKILTARMEAARTEVYSLAGVEFNISSPKQVGEVLFDRLGLSGKPKKTKTGQYVTSEEVLQSLSHKHKVVEKILEYRGMKKLLGTYVDTLPGLINKRTGHIHTSFNQAATATGRLSSSDPNLQNIPVRGEEGKEIRKAFIPDEGCLFFSADYSQIELRVMAHLSGDGNMTEAFREGQDIHAATAARIYHKTVGEVTRDERSKAKRANFGIIYGITVFGLAERLDIPRGEAKALIDGYFENFPMVKEYMTSQIAKAREKGYVETLFGRRRYLPDINSRNATVRGYSERNAINAPIQGSAADIIKVAMIRVARRFRDEGIRSKMMLQVHDELDFSVFPDEKERVEQIVVGEMEGACRLAVPLIVDSGWGANWLEAH